jgi:hypothetical protein
MLEEKNLDLLREENLAKLSYLYDRLLSYTKKQALKFSCDEIVSKFVNVSAQGINLETDNMPYKYISINGSYMEEVDTSMQEITNQPADTSKKEVKIHKNRKPIVKKGVQVQIFHIGSTSKVSIEQKREVLEFVYRWKLARSLQSVQDDIKSIQKAVSFKGEANA